MMAIETLYALALLIPLATSALCMILKDRHNARDWLTFVAALATFACTIAIALSFDGSGQRVELFTMLPGFALAFHLEPLGVIFSLVASGLWIVTHVYGVGYMRGNKEKNHARFFACFAFAIFAALGIAFSANLITLFLFYELLTVSTYPLVTHKGTAEAKAGGRTYLGILMGTSIVFLLTAVVWSSVLAGTSEFKEGGILGAVESPLTLAILLALFAFGIGKAALMPFHRWLPAAMVAPTPVSALLHAVAVVKAGVFCVLKIDVYVFGVDRLAETGASNWLIWLAAFSILSASMVAMTKDNLKARLAYSTISQLSYITLGMALATSMGVIGGGVHIVTHALGKITLFMCAGAIYVATHKTEISQMQGLGRAMPFTFAAFGIGALSIIGLPPLGGSWSKWALMMAAADTGHIVIILVLMVSSLLNVAYLVPIFAKGFYLPAQGEGSVAMNADTPWRERLSEAPLLCVLPPCLTAILCIISFFYAADIAAFIEPIVSAKAEVGQ
ncbi:proton-conducting transporter membrane subunit [Pseudahrensia aquimaris]|uniref:Proton-conducting transporter membrane subunit n=1 Tax=Pseudahrensia aquimaris TaxID=744461 RepID=A0ABW3FCI3_9HYPH